MNYGGGVNQNQNGLDPTAFNKPQEGTQGQYNPLELLMRLMQQKKQGNFGAVNQMEQTPQAGVNFPDFNHGMNQGMPQGMLSPNGQIMPNFKGLLG